eukprot:194786-Pyramimonas_sp.AAC.1
MHRRPKEPQEKLQKPSHHTTMGGVLRFTNIQRLILSHTLWRCGMQNYKRKGDIWRQKTTSSLKLTSRRIPI